MITLEINSTDIRLLETNGDKVLRWARRSLESGTFEEEVISDPQALSTAVKQLMTSSGIQGRDVAASIGGLYSLSRIITVPTPLGVPVTEEAVIEAAEDVMPVSEGDLYLSWQTIAAGEGGQQMLVVGVPRDVIDSEVQALKSVGVNARTLDLKGMALARVVNREQALILNIESTSLDVVIVINGIAEVMRTIAWQQEDLSLEEEAEHLTSVLEMTVSFYNSHHPHSPLATSTPLFITGQTSGDLELIEELQARLEYRIEPLAPPLEYPPHLPISQYAVNIGLALKGAAVSKNAVNAEHNGYSPLNINLLPPVYRPWRPSRKQTYFFCAIIAAIALMFPLYNITTGAMAETSALNTRYNAINKLMDLRKAEIKNREPLQGVIGEYNTIVNMGGGFTEDIQVINREAEWLGVEVRSISHQGSSINIVCQAADYISFRNYLTALEQSGRFLTPIPEPERFPYLEGGTVSLKPKPAE